ncbi:hypothetical protein TNCV_4739601 [Trichonephila clavipes]|nr:hypothetical protein TNCV_4739601 [Trichonephila clavipes]
MFTTTLLDTNSVILWKSPKGRKPKSSQPLAIVLPPIKNEIVQTTYDQSRHRVVQRNGSPSQPQSIVPPPVKNEIVQTTNSQSRYRYAPSVRAQETLQAIKATGYAEILVCV